MGGGGGGVRAYFISPSTASGSKNPAWIDLKETVCH